MSLSVPSARATKNVLCLLRMLYADMASRQDFSVKNIVYAVIKIAHTS